MFHDPSRALALLRAGCGDATASFREDQEDAIRHIVEGQGRLLVVQKTGWGKSFVYFIAAKLLRERGAGPVLLVSPLLSLMRNQLAAASRMGVAAETINSDNQDDWALVETKLSSDLVDVLVISPERLANERFQTQVLGQIAAKISLLVVDEAHCISDWGHDFRPHYRRLERIVRALPRSLRLLATTATANQRVLEDLKQVLGPELHISRGGLQRASLALQTIRLPSQSSRLAWLAANVPQISGSGIIYALTIRDAEMVASWLSARGIAAVAYTGKSERRDELEQALLENRVKVLVATSALGMGFDKPDLAFVIHYQAPGSIVAYYQQVGRAGRAITAAYGVLLSGGEDGEIQDYFIEGAFPSKEEVEAVLSALQRSPSGLSTPQLSAEVNLSAGRIAKTLELLSLESPAPLVKEGSLWRLTAASVPPSFWQRTERLTAIRHEEQRQMQDYVALASGHMERLIQALDGSPGPATAPVLPPLSVEVDAALEQEAISFLRRSELPIEPRAKGPVGGLPRYGLTAGMIPGDLRMQSGRSLCVWGDAGWGTLVRDGKHRRGPFDEALVAACVQLVQRWAPSPAPTWVTCVPSLRHPTLVPHFAARLAEALGLPFVAVLARTEERPEQKTMANSTYQARNVDGALEIVAPPLEGAVLLVDDVVESRWTLTLSAWLLRKRGSGPVWPLALAAAPSGGSE
jgi:ATP-dependent DNA helicase RecQ